MSSKMCSYTVLSIAPQARCVLTYSRMSPGFPTVPSSRAGLPDCLGLAEGLSAALPATIQSWIIQQLLDHGLDPEGKNGKGTKHESYREFKFVKYPANGQIKELTPQEIPTMDFDVQIRAICRPWWFQKFAGKKENRGYFGDPPLGSLTQELFYGTDGRGGRFPLRPGTELPGDTG